MNSTIDDISDRHLIVSDLLAMSDERHPFLLQQEAIEAHEDRYSLLIEIAALRARIEVKR